jgi:hypothetical protein
MERQICGPTLDVLKFHSRRQGRQPVFCQQMIDIRSLWRAQITGNAGPAPSFVE